MRNKLFFLIVCVLCAISGNGQNIPEWYLKKPTPSNPTYVYNAECGFGYNYREARNEAFARMFQYASNRLGQPIDSEEINRAVQSGKDYEVISAQYNIPINKVCECSAEINGNQCVYILCQVATSGNIPVKFDDSFSDCDCGKANNLYSQDALYVDDCTIYRDGKKLKEGEIRTMFANTKSYELYDRGMRLQKNNGARTVGWLACGVGLFPTIIGGVLYVGSGSDEYRPNHEEDHEKDRERHKNTLIVGSALMGCGIVSLLIGGVILPSIGKSKIRKAVNLYNNGKLYSQIDYGFSGNGIYLTLSF